MTQLVTAPKLADADLFYERLIATHEGLNEAESQALNARLVLILANHIGEAQVLDQALACARDTGRHPASTSSKGKPT